MLGFEKENLIYAFGMSVSAFLIAEITLLIVFGGQNGTGVFGYAMAIAVLILSLAISDFIKSISRASAFLIGLVISIFAYACVCAVGGFLGVIIFVFGSRMTLGVPYVAMGLVSVALLEKVRELNEQKQVEGIPLNQRSEKEQKKIRELRERRARIIQKMEMSSED